MTKPRKSIHDADALLLYQVGPVYCCSPALPVESVIMPPKMSHPPGTSAASPGVFKYASGIVQVVDLRKRFGVDDKDKSQPGRIVVVEVEGGHAGMWVDEIIDVIQFPAQGWSQVPAYIPRHVFTKTLLYEAKIMLYADFENLYKFRETGYLRQHIQTLKNQEALLQVETRPDDIHPDTQKVMHQGALISPAKELVEPQPLVVQQKPESVDPADTEWRSNVKIGQPHHVNKADAPVQARGNKKQAVANDRILNDTGTIASGPATSRASKAFGQVPVRVQQRDASVTPSPVTSKAESLRDSQARQPVHITDRQSAYKAENRNTRPVQRDAEGNILLWIFVAVMVGVVMILYYSVENTTQIADAVPKTEINDVQQPLSASLPEDTEDNVGREKMPVDANMNRASREVMLPAVESESSKELYRADISHESNEIVIVLQQPQDEAEVLRSNEDLDVKADVTGGQSMEVARLQVEEVEDVKARYEPLMVSVVEEPEKTEEIFGQPEHQARSSDKDSLPNTENTDVKLKSVQKTRVVHVVVKGDTLWHIARRYIKDPFRYPELARLSKINNPDLIYPGNKVIIIVETAKP